MAVGWRRRAVALLVLFLALGLLKFRKSTPSAENGLDPDSERESARAWSQVPALQNLMSGEKTAAEIRKPEFPKQLDRSDDDSQLVATPGCGVTERELTLPERANIPDDDQETAREILDELRRAIQQRIPIHGPIDDDTLRDGSLTSLTKEWDASSREMQRALLNTLHSNSQSNNAFVNNVRYIYAQNAAAFDQFSSLLSGSMNSDEIRTLWLQHLSWCSISLSTTSVRTE